MLFRICIVGMQVSLLSGDLPMYMPKPYLGLWFESGGGLVAVQSAVFILNLCCLFCLMLLE